MRIRYVGVTDDVAWEAHLRTMTSWLQRGEPYVVSVDGREVGRVPATQRKQMVDWVNNYRDALARNCAGAMLVFSNAAQRGLLTAVMWLAPMPIPVRIFATIEEGEAWLRERLNEHQRARLSA